MENADKKQVIYLDLAEMKAKDRFFRYVADKTDEELHTVEAQYARWLDLLDR